MRGGVWGGGIPLESIAYDVLHTIGIRQQVIVSKPEHSEFLMTEARISRAIFPKTFVPIVLTTNDFNHEPCCITGEVDDQMINRHLTPKVEAVMPERAQMLQSFRSASV